MAYDRDVIKQVWLSKFRPALEDKLGCRAAADIIKDYDKFLASQDSNEIIEWMKDTMERLDEALSEKEGQEVTAAASCEYPTQYLQPYRKMYRETNNIKLVHKTMQDNFLRDIKERLQLSEELLEKIKEKHWGMAGLLKGNVIYATKMPYDFIKYLEATSLKEKQYHYCHCVVVRDILRHPNPDISPTYCYCGAGFYKKIWEFILSRPVKVEVLESVIYGDTECKIAIYLPKDI